MAEASGKRSEQADKSRRIDPKTRKDRTRIAESEMADDDFGEHIAKIGGHCQIAALETMLLR